MLQENPNLFEHHDDWKKTKRLPRLTISFRLSFGPPEDRVQVALLVAFSSRNLLWADATDVQVEFDGSIHHRFDISMFG